MGDWGWPFWMDLNLCAVLLTKEQTTSSRPTKDSADMNMVTKFLETAELKQTTIFFPSDCGLMI